MGLDTTHDCWHGGYGSFNLWRTLVAEQAGIPLGLMEGHCDYTVLPEEATFEALAFLGYTPTGQMARDILRACVGVIPIKWAALRMDPLHHLLNHSDCDGEIAAEHCAPIADRLAEILPGLPDKFATGEAHWAKERTERFIKGLRLAASKGENVGFH